MDTPAAMIKLFSKQNAEHPILHVIVAPPRHLQEAPSTEERHTPGAALLQVEIQHDNWTFFDLSGHLWGLEITHGVQNERLVSTLTPVYYLYAHEL